MMQRLAAFVVSGYIPATLCVVGFASSGYYMPLGSMLSAAIIGLFGLHYGMQRMIILVSISATILFGLSMILSNNGGETLSVNVDLLLLITFIHWLGCIILAKTLHVTQSISLMMQGLVIISVLVVVAVTLLVPDSTVQWDKFLMWVSHGEIGREIASNPQLEAVYPTILKNMTGFVVGGFVLVWIVSILLARWWQSLLDNPGGFAKEFTQLKLGRIIAIATFILAAITLLDSQSWALSIIINLIIGLLFQGIAIIHFVLSKLENGKSFLFVFYVSMVLLFLMPMFLILIALIGIADNFFHFRNMMEDKQSKT